MPSHRKSWPKVYRCVPVIGSSPIVASQSPRPPATSPRSSASPLRAATKVIPSTASMKNSGEPNASTTGRTMGMARPRTSAPKTAPTSELIIAAPRARPASPFLAIAWPSTIVAAEVGSPGIPNRIDVMSPVVLVTASMPSRKANASTGVIRRTKGSMRASVVGPAETGKDADGEPDGHADEHQPERGPRERPGKARSGRPGARSAIGAAPADAPSRRRPHQSGEAQVELPPRTVVTHPSNGPHPRVDWLGTLGTRARL